MRGDRSLRHYDPPKDEDWNAVDEALEGVDAQRLAAAVTFIEGEAETKWPMDLAGGLNSAQDQNEPPPWNEVQGPTKSRGRPNGLVLRGGRIAAEWGDTRRVDMTFSIAKSYLSIIAGVAVTRGLITSVDDPIRDYVLDSAFATPQNESITWRHMLTQTSEWEGSLWDKPDLVDRNRDVVGGDNARKGTHRDLQAPGSYWEYNDVRVNRLSFSLMQVFREPLASVLKAEVMDPIGASDTWRFHGYRNSYYEIDGRVLQSVPGGSHWGGGLFINSRDHARFGHLILRRGSWGGRQLVADHWIDDLRKPASANPNYGYLWWLNTDRRYMPAAPASSIFAIGDGSNVIWIEPQFDLVVVARWIDREKVNDMCEQIMAAIVD